jgi:hypothetical protein
VTCSVKKTKKDMHSWVPVHINGLVEIFVDIKFEIVGLVKQKVMHAALLFIFFISYNLYRSTNSNFKNL